MLRACRQSSSSSILPNYGNGSSSSTNSSQSSCYVGYGNNSYGRDGISSSTSSASSSYTLSPSYASSSSPGFGKKRRPSYSANESFFPSSMKTSTSWLALGLAFFIFVSGYYQSKLQHVLREVGVETMDEVVQKFHDLYSQKNSKSVEMQERHTILERLNAKLHKDKEELKSSYEKKIVREFSNRRKEEDRMVAREEAFKAQIQKLQTAATREAKRSVWDKFGKGHHYVEFTFVLPSDANETEHHFIVETAPAELMPNAVQLFLEQVAHKLWDNSWFYINGPHVLQAGPMLQEDDSIEEDTFEADRKAALQPFVDAGLDSLAFPEYSHQYPHEKWTLGFTGRPGGPDWYINKQNNTVMHGPGGQYHHDIEEQADPCFAKVIEGFEVVEKIFEEATIEEGDDWEYFFWDPIYIVKASIIDKPHHIVESFPTTNTTANRQQHAKSHHHVDYHKFPKIEHEKL